MDEKKNHIFRKLSEQLPLHSPDVETWQTMSEKLDVLDAETAYRDKLQELPVHLPDEGAWNLIYSRLNRLAYYKTGIRIALSAAAGLLLFFTISRFSDQNQTTTNNVSMVASHEKSSNPPAATKPVKFVISKESATQKANKTSENKFKETNSSEHYIGFKHVKKGENQPEMVQSGHNTGINTYVNQGLPAIELKTESVPSENEIALKTDIPELSKNTPNPLPETNSKQNEIPRAKETNDPELKSILLQKEVYAASALPPVKYYTPVEPKTINKPSKFALDMNYMPENIYNGTNTSLFHNVDLTASFYKGKVRINTSLGMAYNEEDLEFNVSYEINTPVLAMGPGGSLDTLRFNVAEMDSEYTGNEKHQYFTYNLGVGRHLFSSGKFSTWINVGAGFGILLNNPDLVAFTANSVKNQYNSLNVSVNSTKPEYNDVNVNFVTALDFNYKILNRLSITVTPTSRWYVKPVLSLDNQATDELTLGFRTGIKFGF